VLKDEKIVVEQHPALNAVNERLRDDYIADSQRGVDRWNKIIEKAGIDFRLKLPHRAFHRQIGQFEMVSPDVRFSPEGNPITEAEWTHKSGEWLPTEADQQFVLSLMKPVTEPGKMASWIAPPKRGIQGRPVEFEYVKLH
jgi:benzoyl-CoA 2,3-dioxygenase component B